MPSQTSSASPSGNSFAGQLIRLLLGLLFIAAVVGYVLMRGDATSVPIVAIAAAFGAYMAMNIGANDVANNVGPAVGSKVLTLGGALLIAAIFEAAGAIIAGGEVVGTIRSGIINPELIPDPQSFVWLMMAALLAAALWLNLASAVGAPISTTHSIVGAVLGAGIAASGGTDVVNWTKMTSIVASWVVSPVLGAAIAALFLYLIKRTITYKHDMVSAARTHVPVLIALMAWAFATYLMLKGLDRLFPVSFPVALLIGLVVAGIVLFVARAAVVRRAASLENGKQSINRLFALPLVFAAALLSFAHGSNDVANAIGPLAAIIDVVVGGQAIAGSAPIPMWVMVSGALGIAIGLALYGPRVIRTVGSEITELDPMRAFCIAMAATLTVIVASQLGLPISTTHVAVGAVFGVGFLREYLKTNWTRIVEDIKAHHPAGDQAAIDAFMARFTAADITARGEMLRELKRQYKARQETPEHLDKAERKKLRRAHKQELVKRSLVLRIAAAWVITVPASAFIAAILFFTLRGMLME
ncbi:MAG: phosphate permease [Arenimonas sp. SCN 70-307]|uniref:inorganic phosphate transporter n=1 Tax=Arenimonas sp. SCN 70-307 TaxID=1660089 RepID=UPI0008697BF7|nr:inorganic phosphate transporter [Arenimonas sp. SCN 70-307]ODS61376.1 MAG: phosphate permease [Arenimonas sp. SCN 70-307]